MIIRDPDGVLVLTLGDAEHVGGYLASEYVPGPRAWRRTYVSATRVDDEFQMSKALAKVELQGGSVA